MSHITSIDRSTLFKLILKFLFTYKERHLLHAFHTESFCTNYE